MSVDYRVGDVRARMAEIPDGSVSLIASSPPFVALRSYLPADHPDKHLEIGSEPDPAAFIDTLLQLTAEWGRVLAPWGSLAIELGDTYSGTLGFRPEDGLAGTGRQQGRNQGTGPMRARAGAWPKPKCLALVPQLYAIALAYGINPLTGTPSPAGQWLVRNVVVWHRPNPSPGALGDKCRPSTSYITVATRSPKRYYDQTAVRTPHTKPNGNGMMHAKTQVTGSRRDDGVPFYNEGHPAGAPPLDCWFDEYDGHDTWTLTTQPSPLAHYAQWPAKLAERLILSMSPLEVCATCHQPRRRIETATVQPNRSTNGPQSIERRRLQGGSTGFPVRADMLRTTEGWSDCDHGSFRPGVVCDPFAGTGTTLCVADLHGRDAIGIDIDSRNRDLMPRRMDEVRRALFGTLPEMPGQTSLFGEAS